jgi:hypothetical protein
MMMLLSEFDFGVYLSMILYHDIAENATGAGSTGVTDQEVYEIRRKQEGGRSKIECPKR